jgi:hypothetical protein
MKTKIYSIAFIILLGAVSIAAQTGAIYDASHNTLAGGGGMQSAGGNFRLDGTVGQAIAGTTGTAGQYGLRGGFWFNHVFAPTAAHVSVTGRVNNTRGGIVRRVRVILTDNSTGFVRAAQTNQFGYYRFEDVESGIYTSFRRRAKTLLSRPKHTFLRSPTRATTLILQPSASSLKRIIDDQK